MAPFMQNYSFTNSLKQMFSPFGSLTNPNATPQTRYPSLTRPTAPLVTPLPNASTPTGPQYFAPPVMPQVKPPMASSVAAPATATATKPPIPQIAPNAAASAPVPPPAATGTPTPPVTPESAPGATNTPPAPIVSPESQKAYDSAEKAYQESIKMSTDELATQEDLDKLMDSTKKAYLDTKGQAIPLEFITGQMKSIEERSLGLAEPLERRLARLQAQRQSSSEASKFALERAEKRVSEEKSRSAPQSVAQGTTIVKYNPTTGNYENVFTNPKEEAKPASVQEYEYAKKNGYTGTYQQYQNEDANRKALASGAGGANDSAVASWVGLIRSGQAKITSVPAGLKTAVASALGEGGGNQGRDLVSEAVSALTSLKTMSGKSGAIGTNLLLGFGKNIPGSASSGYLAQLDRVKALLTLPNLQYLKGLGAMSDREFNTVSASVAALNPNMSESAFDAELNRITEVMTAAMNKVSSGSNANQTAASSSGGSTFQGASGTTYNLPY